MFEEIKSELFARAELFVSSIPEQAQDFHSYLIDNCGQTITMAIYLAVVALVLLAVHRGVKLSFDLLRFVVIPTIAVGFIGSLVIPYSFFHIVPFAAIVFSTLLFLKG